VKLQFHSFLIFTADGDESTSSCTGSFTSGKELPFPIECLGGMFTETTWTFGTRDKALFGIRTPHCTACSPVALTIETAITKIEQHSWILL
jgi:hypothetical protein